MAFVNVHSLPGVTISVTYHEIDGTPVPSPTTPLSFSAGTYSLSTPQTQWAIAVFEVTSYGSGTIPLTGRITVENLHVEGPYDGSLGIGTGTTFPTRVASDSVPPDTPSADGAATASMDGSTRYFMVGHESGSGPSIQSIGSIVLEMDGDFVLPDFWQDFAITDEADGELHKLFEHSQFPGYAGQPYIAPTQQCWDDSPDPPGSDGPPLTGGSSPPDPPNSGGGPGPPGEPMTCYGTGTLTCCVYSNGQTICTPV